MSDEEDEWAAEKRRALKNEHRIAHQMGRTAEEILSAFHPLKEELPRWAGKGARRNPDLSVDPVSGWAFPEVPGGGLGDPVGNIYDHLE